MEKPDVDFIEGLSPAIAIEQRGSGTNPRSIIATTTEIYDYLRLIYAHIGQPHCPDTGEPIVPQSTSDIVDKVLALPRRTRVMLLAPVVERMKGEFRDVIERLAREGFVRARVDDEPWRLVRVAPLDADGPVTAGPFCCAPTRAGLTVHFTSWRITSPDAGLHPGA